MSNLVYGKQQPKWWLGKVEEIFEKWDKKAVEGLAPGTRVFVFDARLYKDDVSTPKLLTMQPATIVCHYGQVETYYPTNELSLGPYESVIDVIFDRTPDHICRGLFTHGVELLTKENSHEIELVRKSPGLKFTIWYRRYVKNNCVFHKSQFTMYLGTHTHPLVKFYWM